jgi:mannose/fructose/N-acetylgalactosamine-specific phosphotransferase system component IIC
MPTTTKLTAMQFRALIDRTARARDSLSGCRNGEVLGEIETVLRIAGELEAAQLGRTNAGLETERRAMLASVAGTARFRMDHRPRGLASSR